MKMRKRAKTVSFTLSLLFSFDGLILFILDEAIRKELQGFVVDGDDEIDEGAEDKEEEEGETNTIDFLAKLKLNSDFPN